MAAETYYYARVSSKEQNPDRQIDEFKKLGATERNIILDKSTGANLDRPGYSALRNYLLRPGDTLVVTSLDRLSRNKSDISKELTYYKNNNIRVKILDIPTTTVDIPEEFNWVFDMVNNIVIEVYGSIAERERQMIRQRQAEGIAAAKAKGKYLGRPMIKKPDNWGYVISEWKAGRITARKAMQLVGMKHSTFYKLVNEEKEQTERKDNKENKLSA